MTQANATFHTDAGIVDDVASAALTSGQIVRFDDGRAAVAQGLNDVASGDDVALATCGLFRVAAASATVFEAGEEVWWDDSADLAILRASTGAGDFRLGVAVVAKAAGTTHVVVDLNAQPGDGVLAAIVAAGTTATDTTDETTLASVSIPANSLKAGDIIEVYASVLAASTNSTDTFNYKVKIGSSIAAATGAVDLADNDTGVLIARIQCRDNGATGKFVAMGHTRLKTTAAHTVLAEATIDTTAAIVVAVTATMSVASADNQTAAQMFQVRKIAA